MTAEILPIFPRDDETRAQKVALHARDHSPTGLMSALSSLTRDDQANALYVGLIHAEQDRRKRAGNAVLASIAADRALKARAVPVEIVAWVADRSFEQAVPVAPVRPAPRRRRMSVADALTAAVVAGVMALALVFGTSAAAKARADVAMYERMQGVAR